MANILIIEDEKKLADFLLRGLNNESYSCDWIQHYSDVLPKLKQSNYDLILLDRMLEKYDTLNLMPKIREHQSNTMVLMLTALHDIEEKVQGLRAGADDYLGKPFDFDELLARIEALLRRSNSAGNASQTLSQGRLKMHLDAQRVWLADNEVDFTHLEFQMLRYFLSNPDTVLSRERILNKVWGNMSDPLTNIVDVYIRRIRKKLSESVSIQNGDNTEDFIQTIRGSGYRLGKC